MIIFDPVDVVCAITLFAWLNRLLLTLFQDSLLLTFCECDVVFYACVCECQLFFVLNHLNATKAFS